MVAKYQAEGLDIVYTLGKNPGWATANGGCGGVPTDLTSAGSPTFNDFVTALVTRYKGRIKYYELMNEPNIVGWSGTVLQAEQMLAPVYTIIKSIDPNATVLSPATVLSSGPAWMNSYLSIAGAGATFDIYSLHAYPWDVSPADAPEFITTIINDNQIQNQTFGLNDPIFISEWSQSAASGAVTPSYLAVQYILAYASGVQRAIWYQYDNTLPVGNLTGNNQGLNASGLAYRAVASWLLNANFTSPVVRQANTNGVRNTTSTGASNGTPGTVPTNWTTNYPDSAHGISVQVTANSGSINWRVFGTATAGANGQTQIGFEQSTHIAASLGQYWTLGANVTLVAGSYSNVPSTQLSFNEYSSGGDYLTTDGGRAFNATSLATQKYWTTAQTTNASVAFVDGFVSVNYSVGSPIDITLQISAPSMDNGTIYSGLLTEGNGNTAEIAWDSAGGPTTFSAGAFGVYRDLTGAAHAVSGGNVTLTNSPVILESAAPKAWLN